ncbi:hypothetical protein J7E97_15935 [Streptomyces sp. ISL-66]|nr:hypothetical protein [Streptomyces sp. ISL-66]
MRGPQNCICAVAAAVRRSAAFQVERAQGVQTMSVRVGGLAAGAQGTDAVVRPVVDVVHHGPPACLARRDRGGADFGARGPSAAAVE